MGPTKDHEEIRRWAEKHGAVPVEVQIRKFDGEPSAVRFLFGGPDPSLVDLCPIAWDDFFARFDLLGLALVYDDSPEFELLRVEEPPNLAALN